MRLFRKQGEGTQKRTAPIKPRKDRHDRHRTAEAKEQNAQESTLHMCAVGEAALD